MNVIDGLIRSTNLYIPKLFPFFIFDFRFFYLLLLPPTVHYRSHFDYEAYTSLDPGYIQVEWGFRELNRPKYLAAGIINTLAWFFLMFPIVHLAWILSQGGKKWISLHIAISLLVMTGGLTEWISHVLYIGASMTSELLTKQFNLDNWITSNSQDMIGWRTLEITHIVTYGFISAIGAIEWLFLSFVMVLIHISVKRWRRNVDTTTFALEVNYMVSRGLVWIVNSVEWICLAAIFSFTFVSVFQWRKTDETSFGAKWNALGLFIGLLAVVEFIAEIVGFEGYRVAWIFVVLYAALNRLLLIPIWIIILGFQLPNACTKEVDTLFDENNNNSELQLSEQPQQPERRRSEFSIDDDDDTPAGPTSPPAAAFTANELVDSQKSSLNKNQQSSF
ncbi:hypothetical protein FRACYDRAFT_185465 [Fragilariopsis cylindrus CCMP1102]|uniref:Transmembrane protein n=1 Tax=Fragilariopsis cylindrus CCMP1102 TaxID=635003 RepID=A0A1E7FEV5_9STRA|nr:hypothetical protein FRACYDRAFT_185465 [Fragilariopsis cylindrus CCMP1102]|eukprot:OEU16323.1 hypothetical protein FRACYDRAFT_185465 [Fragilariopsis cylindrus CCMP1102]